MNKKFLLSLLSILFLSASVVVADESSTQNQSNSFRQPPQAGQHMTPPDMGNFSDDNSMGQPPHMGERMTPPDMENSWNESSEGQPSQMTGGSRGQRPGRKPDSMPGGNKTPQEWSSQTETEQ